MVSAAQLPLVSRPKLEKKYTIEQYIRREEKSINKHEYHAGKIILRKIINSKRSRLAAKILSLIRNFVDKEKLDFITLDSNIKIKIESADEIIYPDGCVFFSKISIFDETKTTLLNPILVVEVLQPLKINNFRSSKFETYRTIPSFREYVLVD